MTDHLTITKDTNISDEKFKEIMDIFDTVGWYAKFSCFSTFIF